MIFSSYPPPTQETYNISKNIFRLNSKLEEAYVKAVG